MAEFGTPLLVIGKREVPTTSSGEHGKYYEAHYEYQLQSGKTDSELITDIISKVKEKDPTAQVYYVKAENGRGFVQFKAESPIGPLIALAIAAALIIATALVVWFVFKQFFEMTIVEIPFLGKINLLQIIVIGGLAVGAIWLIRRFKER